MFRYFRTSLKLVLFLTLITGVLFPLLMTSVGQALFPYQAQGSLVREGDRILGSELIGQNFSSAAYFHPRPSAAGSGYDAAHSKGSNLAPSSPKLIGRIDARAKALREADDLRAIPVDLVTASASGLDPDISVAAAFFQAPRIAKERAQPLQVIEKLIASHTTSRTFGFLGENRVNVLAINQALDRLEPSIAPQQPSLPNAPP